MNDKSESNTIEIKNDNYDSECSEGKIMLDFWAVWCMPCRRLSQTIEEIAIESDGSYKVGKINVDDSPELAVKFGVMSIPTLIVLENGTEVGRSVGVIPKAKILEMLK